MNLIPHKIFFSLVLGFSLTACGFGDRKQDMQLLADEFYLQISQNHFETALDLCSEDFFDAANRTEWLQVLQSINDKYGQYQSRHLIKWNLRNAPSSDIKDASIGMAFRVIYEKGETVETLTAKGSNKLFITSYDVIPNKRQPRKPH